MLKKIRLNIICFFIFFHPYLMSSQIEKSSIEIIRQETKNSKVNSEFSLIQEELIKRFKQANFEVHSKIIKKSVLKQLAIAQYMGVELEDPQLLIDQLNKKGRVILIHSLSESFNQPYFNTDYLDSFAVSILMNNQKWKTCNILQLSECLLQEFGIKMNFKEDTENWIFNLKQFFENLYKKRSSHSNTVLKIAFLTENEVNQNNCHQLGEDSKQDQLKKILQDSLSTLKKDHVNEVFSDAFLFTQKNLCECVQKQKKGEDCRFEQTQNFDLLVYISPYQNASLNSHALFNDNMRQMTLISNTGKLLDFFTYHFEDKKVYRFSALNDPTVYIKFNIWGDFTRFHQTINRGYFYSKNPSSYDDDDTFNTEDEIILTQLDPNLGTSLSSTSNSALRMVIQKKGLFKIQELTSASLFPWRDRFEYELSDQNPEEKIYFDQFYYKLQASVEPVLRNHVKMLKNGEFDQKRSEDPRYFLKFLKSEIFVSKPFLLTEFLIQSQEHSINKKNKLICISKSYFSMGCFPFKVLKDIRGW